MNDARRRALVIAAHPDDAEFTSGGTIAKLVREQWEVRYVVCTDGDKGSLDSAVSPRALAAIRQQEQRAAAAVLGVADVLFLGHSDGTLTATPTLVVELARVIRQDRPDRLLAWDPWRRYQLHPDHRAAGLAALDAVLAAGNPHYFPEQLDPTRAYRVEEVLLFGTDQPNDWVDINETFAQKIAAIEEHRSQVDNIDAVAERMQQCNREMGAANGFAYAEAFRVLHPFCEA
jgi:LmbE family N-acetylglucosaminyl deacetylase